MRTSVTSGFSFTFYISACALMVLISVGDKAYAKRGCSAFGHSCFGGHGKRFDPHVRDNLLQQNDLMRDQDYESSRLSNEPLMLLPDRKYQGQEERSLFESRRETSRRFDPYTLSFLVGQWLTSHRRLHHPDLEVNKK